MLTLALAFGCSKYTCSTSAQGLTSDQCAYYDSAQTTYYMQACPSGYYCPFYNQAMNITCLESPPPPSPGKAWPSFPCKQDADCYSNSCVNDLCVGLPDGSKCAGDYDCNLGSLCQSGMPNNTCASQVGLGETCNTFTGIMCQNNYVCNNQKCVGYYSKPIGSFVTLDTGSVVCESGHVHQVDATFGYCEYAPKAANVPQPTECTFSCPSNDGFESAQCKCAYNAAGTQYCDLLAGDSYPTLYRVHYGAYMNNPNITMCPYDIILTEQCATYINQKSLFDAFMSLKLMMDWYPVIQGNEECVKETITSAYWNSTFIKPGPIP